MSNSHQALSLINDTWFSFGTFNGKEIQGASSKNLTDGWKKLPKGKGPVLAINETKWAGNRNGSYGTWAPDVYQRCHDNKFVMSVITSKSALTFSDDSPGTFPRMTKRPFIKTSTIASVQPSAMTSQAPTTR